MKFSAIPLSCSPCNIAVLASIASLYGSLAAANTKPPPPPPPKLAPRAPMPMPMPMMRPTMPMSRPMQMQAPQYRQPLALQQGRPSARPMPQMHSAPPTRVVQHQPGIAGQPHPVARNDTERPGGAVTRRAGGGETARLGTPFPRPAPMAAPNRVALAGAHRAGGIDPRIAPALHNQAEIHGHPQTRGLEHGLAIAAALPPRPFLRAAVHRDMAADRAFLARHSADFHSRMVRDFNPHELGLWRAGLWRNEWHYGRRGWWWEAGGAWYAYPQPVLPYPEEVAIPVVLEAPVVEGPDLSAQEGLAGPELEATAQSGAGQPDAGHLGAAQPGAGQPGADQQGGSAQGSAVAAATPSIPPLPPAPVGWYRCYAPSGVYPGVQSCGMAWELVENAPLPGEL